MKQAAMKTSVGWTCLDDFDVKSDTLYFIRSEDSFFKIGRSVDVRSRHRALQTGEPLETGHVKQRHPAGNGEPVSLTENDISVIRERFHGWERASAKTLAAVFGVSVQRIASIVKEN